jgi:maleylacetoacetate isomerase/maleylpyruvate isomerase
MLTGLAHLHFLRQTFILGGMKLHNYFRSSASFRVRIALALKGLPYQYIAVNLAQGDHLLDAYRSQSPEVLVPLLEIDGHRLSQSMAIIEYLDETRPEPPLLPEDPLGRAQVRALAQSVACETHPLNNLRVLKYLSRELKVDEDTKNTWYRHWVRGGLEAFERQLLAQDALRSAAGQPPSVYCWGASPTMADCLLVPQIFNAQRFHVNLDGLPRTMTAFEACMQLQAFQDAQPSSCPDFVA